MGCQERLLGHILGIRLIARQAEGVGVDHPMVIGDQFFRCYLVFHVPQSALLK